MANQNDRLLVPYITTWSAEEPIPGVIIHAPRYGIAYSDETVNDRDVNGILWTRMQSSPGQGRPLFGKVHSLRQRRAMHRLLCQVCAGPADRNERGTLWLMIDHRDDWPDWPELMATVDPPICLRCAHTSRRLCPALRGQYVAVRVGHSTLSGIYGIRYRPSALLPEAVEPVTIAFDSPFASWVCASQLVRNCTTAPSSTWVRRATSIFGSTSPVRVPGVVDESWPSPCGRGCPLPLVQVGEPSVPGTF